MPSMSKTKILMIIRLCAHVISCLCQTSTGSRIFTDYTAKALTLQSSKHTLKHLLDTLNNVNGSCELKLVSYKAN